MSASDDFTPVRRTRYRGDVCAFDTVEVSAIHYYALVVALREAEYAMSAVANAGCEKALVTVRAALAAASE